MKISRRIKDVIAVGTLTLFLVLGIGSMGPVSAMTLDQPQPLLAFGSTPKELDSRAKSDVDQVVGAGTSDQLEGYAQQAKGELEKSAGKVAGQIEGAAEQAQGRAKTDIGKVKGAVEDATDAAQDAGGDLVEDVKDFFDS